MNEILESQGGRLIDYFLNEYWQINCSAATFYGIHKYDHELDHWGFSDRKRYSDRLTAWREEINSLLREDGLSSGRRLDLEFLLCEIEKERTEDLYFNRFERDPFIYPNSAILSCLILLIRDFAPKEERLRPLVARLKDIPRFLSEAKENLNRAESIPGEWLRMAGEATAAGQRFFTKIITETAGESPSLRTDLMAAGTLAAKVFSDYSHYLDNELSRKAEGSFAAGREFFDHLLAKHHLLPYDSAQLDKIGQEYIGQTLLEMKEVAGQLNPRKGLPELIAEIKSDSPIPETLEEYYRHTVKRTRDFVIEKDLVSLPEGESLEIMTTPPTERAVLPYAAYMQPAPFEKSQKGFFWVTPIDRSLSPEKQREQLSGHSRAAIEVRALHEGYPGHHLQLCIAGKLDSKIRRTFGSNVFVEGWALYCEELMKKAGFFSDQRTDLIQLKDQLWRACRVVIDVRLHTEDFGFEQAVDMLVETAMLERSSAVAEVRRYTQNPTQPMSYLIGKIEIGRLAEDFKRKFPNKTLREFHNELLSYGSAPIALVRRELLGT